MKLFQEYSQRHNLSIPYVHHGNGRCVIRNYDGKKFPSRWLFIELIWNIENESLGVFTFKVLYPSHDSGYKQINGYSVPSYFYSAVAENWKWSEHEKKMYSWNRNLKYHNSSFLELITDKNLALLNAWEVFVFMHDTWLAKQNFNIKNLVYESLNKELSNSKRTEICMDLFEKFTIQNPKLMYNWSETILKYFNNYSDWLVDFIQKSESLQ